MRTFLLAAALLAASPAGAAPAPADLMAAGAGAKLACSGVFLTGRPLETVIRDDLERLTPLLQGLTYKVDGDVVTAAKGEATARALYRSGAGCTLTSDIAALRAQPVSPVEMKPADPKAAWPRGEAVDLARRPRGVDAAALDKAVEAAFADTPEHAIDTRAVVVVHDGRIVAERYAPGFGPKDRFLGWSASKTVMGALVGTLVDDGRLALDRPAPVPEWSAAGDPRGAITLGDLLHMSSGLTFAEPYVPGSDSTGMLFQADDMAAYAASRPLAHPPGGTWAYSSGTSNILSRIVRQTAGGTLAAYQDYARTRLFEPAGMRSAVFEPDAAGDFVGSSYLWATARDWARFGLMYLDGGEIGGRRVLSKRWTDYAVTPAPAAKAGQYGAQIWRNGTLPSGALSMPRMPADTVLAHGFSDQYVVMVPSRKTVIVRLGWTADGHDFDIDTHLPAILAALPR